MDLRRELLTVLLLTGLANCFAQNPVNNSPSAKICNEAETAQFLSNVKSVTKNDLSHTEKLLMVLTDLDTNMYAPLREKLRDEGAIFMPIHRTFNNDILSTINMTFVVSHASEIKFLIHANSFENAANIFLNLTNIFPNLIIFSRNLAFALTRSEVADEDADVEQMFKTLDNVAKTSNNTKLPAFVKQLKRINLPIFFSTSSKNNPNEFITKLLNDGHKDQSFWLSLHYRPNFNQRYQELIHCGIQFVNGKITSDMRKMSQNLAEYLRPRRYKFSSVATTYNNIWSFARSNATKNVHDYFDKLLDCFKYVEYDWKFSELHYLALNFDIVKFLFYYHEGSFHEASFAWSEPLKDFHLLNLEDLNDWYQRADDEQLLQRKVVQSCKSLGKGNKLSVEGYVVKLSDVNFGGCNHLKVIELFGVEKAIIDRDLVLIGQDVQVVIIAPIWEVQSSKEGKIPGSRLIDLSGNNGTDFKDEAKNGNKEGNKNGAHGLAGVPGGPAGSFYGIANKIINAEQLTIFANGGRGGKGQNGGHGIDGDTGKTYNKKSECKCQVKTSETHFFDGKEYHYPDSIFSTPRYTVKGDLGTLGGRGGNGGIGGMSGKKGSIAILELTKSSKNPIQSAKDGERGLDGTGGKPGLGGKNGKNVIAYCEVHYGFKMAHVIYLNELNDDTGRATTGLKGQSGISLKNRTIPEDSPVAQSFPSSVNGYKMFLRRYLSDPSFTEKDMLWAFYNALGTETRITELYDTLSLVEQFTGLENQFFELNDRMNFVSSYEVLRTQIVNYAKNPNKGENSPEYGNIIKDLQSDIEKRLKSVQSLQSYKEVSTDLQGEANRYLIPLTGQLEDFRKTNNVLLLLKQKILLLEDKMKGGEKMISDVAQTAISDLEDTLDQELDSLLKEITEMKKKERENQVELKKSRAKLENAMQLKAMLGILKIGCGALGIINPALGFVGAIAASAITVVEARTTGDAEAKVAVIPKALETWAKESESYFKGLKEKQEKVVKEQENFVNKLKQTTTIQGVAVIDKVWAASAKIRGNGEAMFQSAGRAMMQVYVKQETELTTDLKKLEKSEDEDKPKKVEAAKIGLRVAKYLKTTSEAFKTGSETVISIMKDEKKVSEIDEAIRKSQKSLEILQKVEENIYTEVDPLLSSMRTNLGSVERDLGKMDEFQQAVAKWNVTGTIDQIKHTLNKVTKAFKVNEEINRTFHRLLQTFDLLFELHKILLEKKEEHQNKIDETNLHIAHASNLLIDDSQLRYALSELQLVQMSNYVAEKYHEWICKFKQYVFPYSGEKLENLQDLDAFRGEGIDNFTKFVLKNMKMIIADSASDTFSDRKKKLVFRGSNFPDEGSNFSFYIWKKEDNKLMLNKILSGKNVTFVADVRKGDLHFNALKFNRVKLLFTAENASMQEELNNELNNFDVKVIHHGDSKYRFGDTIYEVRNAETPLEFSYAANSTEREIHLVSRLAMGPYMLSPYATWTIQLLPLQQWRNFGSLRKFAGLVDLELIGNAEYSSNSECDSVCEYKMKGYYSVARDKLEN